MIEFFVSYRSADEPHAAALLAKVLSSRAGSERVFLDTASMTAGARFSDDIRKALSSCHTLLAIIGERWMVTEADGTRRIDEPDDYVRREIAYALACDIEVIPVLVGNARLPERHMLPPDIADLVMRQTAVLRSRDQLADAERLARQLAPHSQTQERSATVTNTFNGPVTARTIGISLGPTYGGPDT